MMTNRPVIESDFRKPEFRNAKPEDYEIRDDGAIVRKDRWMVGIYQIASITGHTARREFEIADVIKSVEELSKKNGQLDNSKNAATVAAIEFALKTSEGLEFLRVWMHGDFNTIRDEWPDCPKICLLDTEMEE
ncbi:MAG TPA: hypothetical protein PLU16_15885 [Gallionellaceae bacterium]|nr:hypothetical protein [Gallionellaceae bacterium]HQS76684.1 hypothetical protein [Gallionellaceae bacterium]